MEDRRRNSTIYFLCPNCDTRYEESHIVGARCSCSYVFVNPYEGAQFEASSSQTPSPGLMSPNYELIGDGPEVRQRYTVFVCEECGNPDIEISAWITANGSRIVSSGSDGPTSECWCNICESNSSLEERQITATSQMETIELVRSESRRQAIEQETT